MSNKKLVLPRAILILEDWIRTIVLAFMVAIFLTQVIFVNAQVPSESMEDTIQTGDRILGLRMAYTLHPPERGDIIIFQYPDDETQLYIKRVIGLPGETITIKEGLVYINDSTRPLDSPYVKGPLRGDFGPYLVPENSYFVLGDNRIYSWDSRFWENTFVEQEKIVGQAIVRAWPNPTLLI